MEFDKNGTLYYDNNIENEIFHFDHVKMKVISNARIDMENMDYLNLNNSLNRNY